MKRLIVVAALFPLIAHAFDCRAIDSTTEKAHERARKEQRQEVSKASSEGGAFEQPKQSKDATCTTEMQSIMGIGGFSSGAAALDVILKRVADKAITRTCDRLEKQASASRERLQKAVNGVVR